jgi:hypothetical protein
MDMGRAYKPGVSLKLKGGALQLVNHYAGVKLVCPAGLSAGKWQHAAIVHDGFGAKCFVDGQKQRVCKVSRIRVQAI